MKIAIDQYIATGDMAGLDWIAVAFLVTLLASFGLEYVQTWTLQMTGQRIMFDMRMQIYGHLQRSDLQFYDRNPVGRLMTRVDERRRRPQRPVRRRRGLDLRRRVHARRHHDRARHHGLAAGARRLLRPAAHRPRHAVVPQATCGTRTGRCGSGSRGSTRSSRSTSPGWRRCSCSAARTRTRSRFDEINRQHRDANVDSIFYYAVFYPAIEIVGALAAALIIWFGGNWTLQGPLTLGSLVAFLQYSQRFFRPISDMSEKFNVLQAAMAASERIFKLLDTPAKIDVGARGSGLGARKSSPTRMLASAQPDRRARGSIVFDNVSFAYNGDGFRPARRLVRGSSRRARRDRRRHRRGEVLARSTSSCASTTCPAVES